MKQLNLVPGEKLFIMNEQEMRDVKMAIYVAMKVMDDSKAEGSRDKATADRLEVIHDSL